MYLTCSHLNYDYMVFTFHSQYSFESNIFFFFCMYPISCLDEMNSTYEISSILYGLRYHLPNLQEITRKTLAQLICLEKKKT